MMRGTDWSCAGKSRNVKMGLSSCARYTSRLNTRQGSGSSQQRKAESPKEHVHYAQPSLSRVAVHLLLIFCTTHALLHQLVRVNRT